MTETKTELPVGCTENEDGSVNVPLDYPIKFGTEIITQIRARRLKGRELRKLPAEPTIKDMFSIAESLTAHPPSVLDEMDGKDITKLFEVLGGFLGSFRATGGKQ